MIIDTEYNRRRQKLIVSYVNERGGISLKHYQVDNPHKYVECDDNDIDKEKDFKSWNGYSIKKVDVDFLNRYSIYDFIDSLPQSEKDILYARHIPEIYFIDIETEILDTFPDAETANSRVISLSIVKDNIVVLLGLKDLPEKEIMRMEKDCNSYFQDGKNYRLKYIKYDDEFDLLYDFFNNYIPHMPLMTGWNFIKYDWKYLVNRVKKISKVINGIERRINPNISSPTQRMTEVWGTDYVLPMHRMIFDYMQLYDITDTSIKVKESSSLDFVSSKLVGVQKIKYNGSLKTLYDDDFWLFMYYNAVDSILVQKIHEIRNYISIVFGVAFVSNIKLTNTINHMSDKLGILAITEGVLRNRFKEDGIILFKSTIPNLDTSGIEGGWVKDPIEGMNRWCVTYDFSSLYPSVQRQFYISPENFYGKVDENDRTKCTNGNPIDLSKHVICVSGSVFKKERSATIRMLEDVFSDRKKNKKIMMAKNNEYNEVKAEIERLKLELKKYN